MEEIVKLEDQSEVIAKPEVEDLSEVQVNLAVVDLIGKEVITKMKADWIGKEATIRMKVGWIGKEVMLEVTVKLEDLSEVMAKPEDLLEAIAKLVAEDPLEETVKLVAVDPAHKIQDLTGKIPEVTVKLEQLLNKALFPLF